LVALLFLYALTASQPTAAPAIAPMPSLLDAATAAL